MLQRVDITSQEGRLALSTALIFYQDQQRPDVFEDMYSQTMAAAKDKTEEPKLPRYRKKPRRFLDEDPARYEDAKDLYHHEFLSAVELLEKEVEKRSEQPSISVNIAVEDILVSSAKGQTAEIPELVANMYGDDLNFEELTQQLKILPRYIKASQTQTQEEGASEINIRDLTKLFAQSSLACKMMPDVEGLLRSYLTIRVTTATAEGAFSVLRRMKTT